MDDADKADGMIEARQGEAQAAIQRKAQEIPKGAPGECELCGEFSQRLVRGACAPCRDRYKLK